jgi:hypothetical protein
MYRGILIDRSVEDVDLILSSVQIVGEQKGALESEAFRGDVRFISIEVDEAALWVVLKAVAESLKAPGWFFHVVGGSRLYVVLPRVIFFADEGKTEEIDKIVQYAVSQGIHRDQLNLAKHFSDPFA